MRASLLIFHSQSYADEARDFNSCDENANEKEDIIALGEWGRLIAGAYSAGGLRIMDRETIATVPSLHPGMCRQRPRRISSVPRFILVLNRVLNFEISHTSLIT
jgi:hypothetical protein